MKSLPIALSVTAACLLWGPSPAGAAPLPTVFEQNQGQLDPAVAYVVDSPNARLFVTPDALVTVLPGTEEAPAAAVYTTLRDANHRAALEGIEPLPGRVNRFIGDRAYTGIATFGRVRQCSVYPGIDLVLHMSSGAVEYDFEVAPGADPSRIALDFEGADALSLSPEGDLLVLAAGRAIHHRRPVAWQTIDGRRIDVAVAWRVEDESPEASSGRLGARLDLGAYDPHEPLTIDPPFAYSTFLGGSSSDQAKGVTTDAEGYIYVAGETSSNDFPLGPGHLNIATKSQSLAFITKIDPNAAGAAGLVWSTYLGGVTGGDTAKDVGLDPDGNVYVVGWTTSNNFPVTASAYQDCSVISNGNGFLSKLDPSGSNLLFSTCLRGDNVDEIHGVEVDAAERAHLVGRSASSNFPTTDGAFQKTNTSYLLFDTIALVVDTLASGNATLVYSTYFGDCSDDTGEAIEVDAQGVMYLTGASSPGGSCASKWRSASPTPRAGGGDAWVTRLDPTRPADQQLLFTTFLGGSSEEDGNPSGGIGVDALGNVFVVGSTMSANFPITANHLKGAIGGNEDGFFTVFSPTGTMLYSTYLGGSFNDFTYGLRVGKDGLAYLVGQTSSSDMTVTSCTAQAVKGSGGDAFLSVIDPWTNTLVYSTFLGGGSTEFGYNLALDPDGNAIVVGQTSSSNFPVTAGAFQTTLKSLGDAFVTKVFTPAKCSQPGVRIADTSVVEGNLGSATAVVDVYLLGSIAAPVTFAWDTFPGTATPGADYLADAGEVTFDPGDVHQTIAVEVLGDWGVEPNETLFVQLTPVSGDAALQDSLAVVEILDDDVPPTVLAPADVTVTEGSLATASGTFVPAEGASLTASIGSLVVDDAAGTYSWSFQTSDGPDESQAVTLTLADGQGPIASAGFALTVFNVAPSVTVTGPTQVTEGTTHGYYFSVSDPGTDGFTVGTSSCGASGTLVAGSLATTATGGSFACTFGAGPAIATLLVAVTDDDGDGASTGLEVSIADVPPALALAGSQAVPEGETASYAFSYSGSEPAQSFTPDCGTAGLLVGALDYDAGTGLGAFECHFADGPHTSIVSLLVIDLAQASASASLAVAIANLAPSATLDGPTSAAEGTSATYAFTVVEAGADGFSVTGDPDCGVGGELVAGSLVTTVGGGAFTCTFPDGPATTEVALVVSDDDGAASAPATLTATVQNVAPSVVVVGPTGVGEGTTSSFDFTATDPGSDVLLFDGVSCGASGSFVPGSLALSGVGPLLTGTFTCAFGNGPADSQVTVGVSDSDAAAATGALEVAVMDIQPIASIFGAASAAEGASASYSFTVDSVAGDGFTLATGYPDCGAAGELVAGSLSVAADGGSFECAFVDGPDVSEVAVQVVDGDLAVSNVASVMVAVSDVAPSVTLGGPGSVLAGTMATYSFTVVDPGVDPFTLAAGSPDCGAGVLVSGSLIVDGAGGSFACAFPSPATTTVEIQVESDGLLSDTASLTVTVDPAPVPSAYMTGAGQMSFGGKPSHHGFSLDCDPAASGQQLQVSWKGGHKFSLDVVATLGCSDDPTVDPGGGAPIDTLSVTGQGRLDGVPGAAIDATFVDAGEPGTSDRVDLVVKDPNGVIVLSVSGLLLHGNHQAQSP